MILLSSCATIYRPILPFKLDFPDAESKGFAYRDQVLREAGNRRLARKADIFKIHVVAVRIQNNTGKTLRYGRDYTLESDNREVILMKPAAITAKVKQSTGLYLFYMLLLPLKIQSHPNGYTTKTYRIGMALGPGIAGANMTLAATSNKRFLQELEMESLENNDIKPGETFTGLIGIKSKDQPRLSLKYKE